MQAMALFDDELANKTSKASIKAKPHPETTPNKKLKNCTFLDLKETNSNLKAKIWQDTNEFNDLKQEIK